MENIRLYVTQPYHGNFKSLLLNGLMEVRSVAPYSCQRIIAVSNMRTRWVHLINFPNILLDGLIRHVGLHL